MTIERGCCKCPKCIEIRNDILMYNPNYNYLTDDKRNYLRPLVIDPECVEQFRGQEAYIVITNHNLLNCNVNYVKIRLWDYYLFIDKGDVDIDDISPQYITVNGDRYNIGSVKMVSIVFPTLKYRYMLSVEDYDVRRLKRVIRRLNGHGVNGIYKSNLRYIHDDIKRELNDEKWDHYDWHDKFTERCLNINIKQDIKYNERWD